MKTRKPFSKKIKHSNEIEQNTGVQGNYSRVLNILSGINFLALLLKQRRLARIQDKSPKTISPGGENGRYRVGCKKRCW